MTGLTADLVVDGRDPRTPALAPNGRLLCHVLAPTSRTGDHLDTELWLVDTDGAVAARRATADTATESQPRWSADSETLFFLSDRADRGTPQLHGLTLADGTMTTLTSWRAGVIDHLPLADPNVVALLAEDEPSELDERRARDRDDAVVVGECEPRARLRLLDLRTGRVTTPNVFGDRHVVELRQRPDGGPLAVLTWASADNDHGPRTGQLHLFDPTPGPRRTSDRSGPTHNLWPGGRARTAGTSVTSRSPHRFCRPAPPCSTWPWTAASCATAPLASRCARLNSAKPLRPRLWCSPTA